MGFKDANGLAGQIKRAMTVNGGRIGLGTGQDHAPSRRGIRQGQAARTARVEHSVKHVALGAQLHPQDGHFALPIGQFWHPAIGFAPQDIGMAVATNLAMQKTGLAQGGMCRTPAHPARSAERH